MAVPSLAGAPTEQLRETTDKILSILNSPDFKNPAKYPEKRQLIRNIGYDRFDWAEMSRRVLGRYWAQRTDQEKKAFVDLFGQFLEQIYIDRIKEYSGETIQYKGESVEDQYGKVSAVVVTPKEQEISVEYRVIKHGNDWLIYDVVLEGVSLVNNYRTQFDSILLKSSFQDLIKKLEAKIASK
jgi:phospholipid transport system substrate-binding protein